jgi:hypothetical protein
MQDQGKTNGVQLIEFVDARSIPGWDAKPGAAGKCGHCSRSLVILRPERGAASKTCLEKFVKHASHIERHQCLSENRILL